MSEYKTYIELFNKASKKSIQDILDDEFYQEILLAKEHNCYYQIKDKYETIMHNFIASDRERIPYVKLRHNLVRNFLWTDLDLHKFHYNAFNLLSGYIHKELDLNSSDWVNAIVMAIFGINNNIINIYPKEIDDEYAKNSYPQQYYSVQACKFFKNKGFKISVKNGEVKFNNIQDIFVSIDNQAKRLGIHIYYFITDYIHNDFLNKNNDLYQFRLSSSRDGEPLLPIGFIYQISLKHIDKKPSYANNSELREAMSKLLEYCVRFASLFELQSFGLDWEMMLISETKGVFDKLQEIIHLDNFFKIEQYNPSDVIDFVKYLANCYIDNKQPENNINQFLIMVDFFEKQIQKNKYFIFNESDLPKDINYDFFEKFYFNSINQDFKRAFDFDKTDFKAKPFVKINGKYLIIQPKFSAISLYIILCNILGKEENSQLGLLIESYIVHKLLEKSIDVIYNRQYKVNKDIRRKLHLDSGQLECDIVLQSKEYIFFIEIKKKELTRNAKSGDVFFILQDLSKSLLASQTQANKHMRYLMENKKIVFYKAANSPEQILDLNNREIIKISLSSLDYLSLHSKDVFQKFMRLLYNKELVISDNLSEWRKKIATDFNEQNYKLGRDLSDLHSDWQLKDVNGLLNCYFLNIFHLFFMIRNVNNMEEFAKLLLSTRNITVTGFRDFYQEVTYIEQLHKTVDERE